MSEIRSIYNSNDDSYCHNLIGDVMDCKSIIETFRLDNISYTLKEFVKYIIENEPNLMMKYENHWKTNSPFPVEYPLYRLIHEEGYYSIDISGDIEDILQENIDKNIKKQVTEFIANVKIKLAEPPMLDFTK